jgi:hypothetical protein
MMGVYAGTGAKGRFAGRSHNDRRSCDHLNRNLAIVAPSGDRSGKRERWGRSASERSEPASRVHVIASDDREPPLSRMRPIPLAACCAATTTSTLPCAPHPRLRGLVPPMNISSTSMTNHRPAQLVQQIPRRAITPQPQHPLQAQGAGPAFLTGYVLTQYD